MLRVFVEVDRATMGPERLAAKLPVYERLYRYIPAIPGRPANPPGARAGGVAAVLSALPPRPVRLDGTGPAGFENRISAPCARLPGSWRRPASCTTSPSSQRHWPTLLHHGPSAPVWRQVRRVRWTVAGHRQT